MVLNLYAWALSRKYYIMYLEKFASDCSYYSIWHLVKSIFFYMILNV